ncbi:hypothetical protein, partial [Streptosporangium brasiliense]|uniref:hypothetical protein n=1 Tax=Streptosporangium brasiliense TaxID=47480 RepID=UPI0027D7F1EB
MTTINPRGSLRDRDEVLAHTDDRRLRLDQAQYGQQVVTLYCVLQPLGKVGEKQLDIAARA